MTVYYDDLDVGDVYMTDRYTVTKEEIITFAKQFDPQPFHIDEDAARDSIFGELVASGLHTLCISSRLSVLDIFQAENGIAFLGGIAMEDVEWHEPVYPGDTLAVEMEVIEKTSSDTRSDRGYVTISRSVLERDTAVMTSVSHCIIAKR